MPQQQRCNWWIVVVLVGELLVLTTTSASSVIYSAIPRPDISSSEIDLQGNTIIDALLTKGSDVPSLVDLRTNDDVDAGSGDDAETDDDRASAPFDVECGIWLAPSTIEGAGLGMFAGIDFKEGQDMLVGGDSVIAITDIKPHNTHKKFKGDFLWDEYTWNAEALKMEREGYHDVNVASEGFGSAANSFLPLYNVEEWTPLLNDGGLHRSKHPGAGASTLYHHRKSTAKKPITAGSELYVSYGENWFTSRPSLGPIPLTDDLDSATEVLKRYTSVQEELRRKNIPNATDIAAEVWTTFVKGTKFDDSRILLGGFKHHDPDDLHTLQTMHDSDVKAARAASSHRSLEWLRHHGTCGDHIVGKPSTLSNAGMGAFATRSLPVNTIVAQLPMIHITNRSRLEMFALRLNEDNEWVPVDGNVTGYQLLLNYCYGHKDSTLLLCPYGPLVNYVNHNRSMANVKLQWGSASKGNHMPHLLDSTIAMIEESDATAKLAMELVAIREIEEGEEILLDYGSEWDEAWRAYVESWTPVPNAESYISAAQLNADKTSRLRTVYEEIRERTFPDNVEMLCDTACEITPDEVKQHYDDGTLESYLLENDATWWPCSVLRYHVDEKKSNTNTTTYLYTVHLFKYENGKATDGYLIKDVPRELFYFRDKPYTSDVFLPNAFRHDIRIPDTIFPTAWRNLLS